MDPKLSKTGLRMFLRPLVMFLWSFEVLAKRAEFKGGGTKKNVTISLKSLILAIFCPKTALNSQNRRF